MNASSGASLASSATLCNPGEMGCELGVSLTFPDYADLGIAGGRSGVFLPSYVAQTGHAARLM